MSGVKNVKSVKKCKFLKITFLHSFPRYLRVEIAVESGLTPRPGWFIGWNYFHFVPLYSIIALLSNGKPLEAWILRPKKSNDG